MKVCQSLAFLLLISMLLTACASKPPWEQTDPDKQARAYSDLGMGYLDAGNFSRSVREFSRALELRPRHPQALHGMALTYQAQGEYELAEDYFKQTLRADRNKTSARNNYAAFLFEQSRYDEARAEFERASQDMRYPNRAIVLENLGYVLLAKDDPITARAYFQQSLRNNPNVLGARRELLRLDLAEGQLSSAQRHWEQLESRGSLDRDLLNLGIELALATGNQQKQEELKQRLQVLNSQNTR